MQLSLQQKIAVEHKGSPALVVAGAGSGKTRTLTAKITHLLETGYDASRILAITFTNKAAEEMKNRLVELTGASLNHFPWVRTYHSACFKILKTHCHLAGFTQPLQILSAYHQTKIVKEIMAALDVDKKYASAIMSDISKAKNSGDPEKYFDKQVRATRFMITDIFDRYEKALKGRNAVDFDNILLIVRNILRDHPDVRASYQEYFQYILVDEYQDTNNLQEELTRLLVKNGNLFCVGDDWQSVYGFRGSNVNHFLSFAKTFDNAQIFRLEENYRSADEIVQVANALIGHNTQRMEKRCFSGKKGGVIEKRSFYNETDEAVFVAKKARVLNSMGIPYEQMAVIYRTKALSLSFEKTFRAYKVPYVMKGARGFFERKEVIDINCYLAAAFFPKDDVAFERIINTPKRGIGPSMLTKIKQVRTGEMALKEAAKKVVGERILSPKVHKELSFLLDHLDRMKEMPPKQAIGEILGALEYEAYLKTEAKTDQEDFTSRMENIEQLIYAASLHDTIGDYLEDASLVNEDKEDDEKSETGVSLSTVHASKGLEYMVVFVAGCEENIFPHWRSMEKESDLQEERRLMYVAMTRAEKYLYFSSAELRRGQYSRQSRFIDEVEDLL
jgi:DNA helicase-2/ATP-dependent DNA helicase PcrA